MRRSKHGFTLVELLVVIAIIGVLVSLLLPAVQAAREAARRAQCTSNMKNLALAVLNYESAFEVFPPAYRARPKSHSWPGESKRAKLMENWVILTLPYLEQQALRDQFVVADDPMSDAAPYLQDEINRIPRSTDLEIMLCPSDSGRETKCSRYGGDWARGNYGINMIESPRLWDDQDWNDLYDQGPKRGVAFVNEAMKIAQITDGTSNTIMLAEMRIGLSADDPRGSWAMGMCSSSTHCNWAVSNSNGPNDCGGETELLLDAAGLIASVGEPTLRAECMMPHPSFDLAYKSSVRSLHPGGLNMALADASVRFISDFIDSGPINECDSFRGSYRDCYEDGSQFRTLQRLAVSEDAYAIDASF